MKLVIVEDEIRIREGLINLLKKHKMAIDIVGVAEDGADGYDIIKSEQPDLIITDIRMPRLDGIEMLKKLRREKIQYKAIVLSAYSEFEYAQQAIKLGVVEYLIKPIAADELMQAIENIQEQLINEHHQKSQSPQQLKALKNIFYSILLGSTEVDDELSNFLMSAYRLNTSETFAVLDIYLGKGYEKIVDRLKDELTILLEGASFSFRIIEHKQGREVLLVVFNMIDAAGTEKYFQHLIFSQIKVVNQFDMAFAWTTFDGLEKMKEKVSKVRQDMDWSITLGKKALISDEGIKKIRFDKLSYPIDLETKAKNEICALEYDKLKETLLGLLKYFKSHVFCPAEVKDTTARFLWAAISVIKEIDFDLSNKLDHKMLTETMTKAVTWEELNHAVTLFCEMLCQVEDKQHNSVFVRRTKSMIQEHYNQGITLEEIAEKLYITPEYLGALFHKEQGENFTSYIKKIRIKKAKRLLIGTDMKVYDISAAVGYADSKYFSRVFRELTGQLPAEFRKLNK